jgi:hypothetical protein
MSYFKRAPTTYIDLQLTADQYHIMLTGPANYALTGVALPADFLPEEIVFVQLTYVRQRVKNQFAGANDIIGGKFKIYNQTTTTWEEIAIPAFLWALSTGPMTSGQEIHGIKTFILDTSSLTGVWSDYFPVSGTPSFRFDSIECSHDSIEMEGHVQGKFFTR